MKKKSIYLIVFGIIIVISALVYQMFIKVNEYNKTLFYMDTYISIKVYTNKSETEVNEIFDDIDYLYSLYHKLTDRYNSYEGVINLYYLNEILSNNEEVELNPLLATMIQDGIDYYGDTNGIFNMALGNVITVWKNAIEDNIVPSYDEIVNSGSISIDDIKLDGNTYTKYNSVKLDLGGYAKGYVTELVGQFLESLGIKKYLINAGGNVKVGDTHQKDFYLIGIENPNDKTDIYRTINVKNKSIVTSGDYQRYTIVDGIRYHHLIDPSTLYPGGNVKAVTVITEDSGYADIMSTYLFLLPVAYGIELVNSLDNIEAIWYIDEDNIVTSEGFSNYEQE